MTEPIDIDGLQAWVGRSEACIETVTAASIQEYLAMLDRDAGEPQVGQVAPPGAHWLYAFLPAVRQSALGEDGHPHRGGFLPPVSLPRRMWAGSALAFGPRPLRVGDRVRRESTIASVRAKVGRTGPLVFVEVRHGWYVGDDLALEELQSIVYRGEDAGARPRSGSVPEVVPPATFSRRIVPDSRLLFRYSALTHNAHRIHYDHDYVRNVEGYPGLVVHGPLVATLLLDLVERQQPGATLARFAFRARAPLFADAPLALCGRPAQEPRTLQLWATDAAGSVALEATAVLV